MNRSKARDYLTSEYAALADEAGMDSEDCLRAYSLVIDQALRLLGYRESELAGANTEDDEVPGYLAALDYFVLSRFTRIFSLRTDVSVGGAISARQSQTFTQVGLLLQEAKDRLGSFGLMPNAEPLTIGRLTLDFLEPDVSIAEGAW